MYLLEVIYKATHYVHVPLNEYTSDTEFSHTEVKEFSWRCLIPENKQHCIDAALAMHYTEQYRLDLVYKVVSTNIICDVQAIMHPLQRRF